MALTPEQQEEFAKLYEQSLKEALAGLDKIAAEAKAMQDAAVDEILKTKEARNRLVDEADTIAKEQLEGRRKQIETEIRRTVKLELAERLIRHGRSRSEIISWLDLPPLQVENIRNQIVNTTAPDMDAFVEITQDGRGGTIKFLHGDNTISMPWEFGGGKALALILIPDSKTWEAQTGYPLAERERILGWIARQVLFQRVPFGIYAIDETAITIFDVR